MATLYIRYIQLYRKLESSYDELLHPQKRRLMKEAITATMGRLIEIKHILVDLECTDYFNMNDILLDLRLTPDALKFPVPRQVYDERRDTVDAQRQLLQSLSAKDFSFGQPNVLFPEMTVLDAVKIIQVAERARQGVLRAKYMNDIKLQALKEKEMLAGESEINDLTAKAALVVQRVYRGYKARMLVKKVRLDELRFLGMERPEPPKVNKIKISEENRERRKQLQKQFEEDYLQALVSTKEKILRMEGTDMKEAIQDDFRQWYMEYKRINGKFPEFPPEEVWQQPNFKFSLEQTIEGAPTAVEKAEKDKGGKKDDKAKPKEDPKAAKGGKGKGKEEEEVIDPLVKYNFGTSTYLEQINKNLGDYNTHWANKDESSNFAQRHDQEIIKADKRKEVEAEIKKEVFVVLEDELKNLILAVENGKKKGKGGKGKGKGKKGKKDKGKKGKKEKDLTANRTIESLVEELVKSGLLQQYQPISLSSILGNFNLIEQSTTKEIFITPTMAELKRLLVEYCILPMGMPRDPDGLLPPPTYPKIASILLFGPSGVGKTKLVQAIASEMGAQIFNLSPRNTAGQFLGKANVTKMIHMVFKVARLQGPSVIYLEGVEMIFAKKIPKEDTSDPKRIKKDLAKAIKLIRDHNERVVLIATSNKPWEGDAKAMLPLFDKALFCPKPDYSTRYALWRHFISRRVPVHDSNLSILTRMSDGLSSGMIEMVCERVLTPRRLRHLNIKPLKTEEFINHLLDLPPTNPEETKMFRDYCDKTALMKKRVILINGPEEDPEAAKKAPAKKK